MWGCGDRIGKTGGSGGRGVARGEDWDWGNINGRLFRELIVSYLSASTGRGELLFFEAHG
jgi:hypothetical protein